MKEIAATCRNPVQRHSSSRSPQLKPFVGRRRGTISGRLSAGLILLAIHQGSAMAVSTVPGVINPIGVENEYADVIAQIGGKYVQVNAIITDPNTDPHTFEVNPRVAAQITSEIAFRGPVRVLIRPIIPGSITPIRDSRRRSG
jgi:zinc/manganese transport system substrate-binding protein